MTCLRRASVLLSLGIAIAAAVVEVPAETALDLSERLVIDGYSTEFADSEAVFFFNEAAGLPEESTQDSEWGPFNDVGQIKITWDKDYLYLALDGYIGSAPYHNNVILLLDVTNWSPATSTDDGMDGMTQLSAWRRNFVFSDDFTPDIFLATWDLNPLPQMWRYATVQDPDLKQVPADSFSTVATFEQSSPGRSMEAAIPWSIFFFEESAQVTREELGDGPVWSIPEGMDTLRFAAVITGGADGTGGPDSAPDNFGGHTTEGSDQVLIDNYAILPLDGGDAVNGVPDFGVEPRARLSFKRRPPIRGVVFEVEGLSFERAVVSPEENLPLEFSIRLDPAISADEAFRTVQLTARIYDNLGNPVRVLYRDDIRSATQPSNPEKDRWDGRDMQGRMVRGGIYILSVVSEPGLSRLTRAFAVVR